VENDGTVESVESQRQASPSFHEPLEISPRAGEIPTFPQLRRVVLSQTEKQAKQESRSVGRWKSGNPKAGFPLSHRPRGQRLQGAKAPMEEPRGGRLRQRPHRNTLRGLAAALRAARRVKE